MQCIIYSIHRLQSFLRLKTRLSQIYLKLPKPPTHLKTKNEYFLGLRTQMYFNTCCLSIKQKVQHRINNFKNSNESTKKSFNGKISITTRKILRFSEISFEFPSIHSYLQKPRNFLKLHHFPQIGKIRLVLLENYMKNINLLDTFFYSKFSVVEKVFLHFQNCCSCVPRGNSALIKNGKVIR